MLMKVVLSLARKLHFQDPLVLIRGSVIAIRQIALPHTIHTNVKPLLGHPTGCTAVDKNIYTEDYNSEVYVKSESAYKRQSKKVEKGLRWS